MSIRQETSRLNEKQLVQKLHALESIPVSGGLKFVEEYDDFRASLSDPQALEIYMKKGLPEVLSEMWQNYKKRYPDLILVAELIEIIVSSSPHNAKQLLRNTNLLYEELIFFKENLKLVPRTLDGSEKPLFNIDIATKEVFTQAYRFEEPNDTKIMCMLVISRTILAWFQSSKSVRKFFVENFLSCMDILLSFCCKHSYSVRDDTGKASACSVYILKAIKELINSRELAGIIMRHPNFLSWLLEGGLDVFKDASEEMDWLFEILTKLSSCSSFPVEYRGVSLLNIIFFDLVEGYFAPDLIKNSPFHHNFLQKGPNPNLKLILACEAFRNLSKNRQTKDQFLLELRTQRTDFAPRLMVEACAKKRFEAFIDIASGLTDLLSSSSYTLPKYSRVLLQYCVFSQARSDPGQCLCLLALLRMMKYQESGTSEKIPTFEMIKMYLEGSAQSSLAPLLQKEFEKVDDYLEKRIRSDMEKPVNENDLIFSSRGGAEVLRFRQGPEETKSVGFAQLVNSYKGIDDGEPWEGRSKKREAKTNGIPNKMDEMFGFQIAKLKKKPKNGPRYFFENNIGEIACFHVESKKKCPGCKLLRGLCHIPNNEEFFSSLSAAFSMKEKQFWHIHQTGMACVQFIYETTLEYNSKFFLERMADIILPLINDKRIEPSTRSALLLYVSNYHDNHPDLVYVLMGSKFILFHDNVLAEFMSNFEIEMFKDIAQQKWSDRKNRKKKEMPPSIESDFPITKIMDQVQRQEKVGKNAPKESQYLPQLKAAPQKEEINSTCSYSDIIWDSGKRCFAPTKVVVSDRLEKMINEFEEDKIIDSGSKYTRYFWRLHMILHSFKLVELLFAQFKKGLAHTSSFWEVPHQTIEISTVFAIFMNKMLPSEPFNANSECWTENKMMMKDILGQMVPLFYQVVTYQMANLNLFIKLLLKNPQYFSCLTSLIGNLPSGPSKIYLLRVLNHIFFELLTSPLKGNELEVIEKQLFEAASFSARELQKLNHSEKGTPAGLGQFALEMLRLMRLTLERNPEESLTQMMLHTISQPFQTVMSEFNLQKNAKVVQNDQLDSPEEKEKKQKNLLHKDLIFDLQELFNVMLGTFCETMLKMSEKPELSRALLESAIFDYILKQSPTIGDTPDNSYKESIYLVVSKVITVLPPDVQIGQVNPFFAPTIRSLIERDESLKILPLLRALKLMLVRERNLRPGFRSLATRLHFLQQKFKVEEVEDPSRSLNFKETKKEDEDFQNELNMIYHYSRIDGNVEKAKLENVLEDLKLEDGSFRVDKDFSMHFQNKMDRADLDRKILKFIDYEIKELLKILKVVTEKELKEAKYNNPARRERLLPGAGTVPSNLMENLHENEMAMQESKRRMLGENKRLDSPQKTLEQLYPNWKSEQNRPAGFSSNPSKRLEHPKSQNIQKVLPGIAIPDAVGIKLQIKQDFQNFNKFASSLKEEALHHSLNISTTSMSPLLPNHRINLSMVDYLEDDNRAKNGRKSSIFGRTANRVVASDSPELALGIPKYKDTIPKDSKPIEMSNKLMMSMVTKQNQSPELARVNEAYGKVLLNL